MVIHGILMEYFIRINMSGVLVVGLILMLSFCRSLERSQWRVSGTEQEYLLSKTRVKHDRAWSPNGSVTIMC